MNAYRRHIELTDEELDRFERMMYLRPLYLAYFSYRRYLVNDKPPGEDVWGFIDPEYMRATAAATRAAYLR